MSNDILQFKPRNIPAPKSQEWVNEAIVALANDRIEKSRKVVGGEALAFSLIMSGFQKCMLCKSEEKTPGNSLEKILDLAWIQCCEFTECPLYEFNSQFALDIRIKWAGEETKPEEK